MMRLGVPPSLMGRAPPPVLAARDTLDLFDTGLVVAYTIMSQASSEHADLC